MNQDSWGLVLAGGGGKGAYQAGVMKALAERGWDEKITAVSGTSIGALNAALFVMGDVEKTEAIWSSISPLMFLDVEFGYEEGKPRDGVFSRDGLLKLMEEHLDYGTLSSSPRRIIVSASRKEGSGHVAEYFSLNGRSADEIRDILLASSALPVIYSSVQVGEESYRDGGLGDNIPIRPLHDLGYRHLIVVGLERDLKLNLMTFPGTEILPILPSVDLGDFVSGTLDFTREGALRRMHAGYEDACAMLTWYAQEDREPWSVYREKYMARAEELEKQIDGEARRRKLQERVDEGLDKIKDLMKKYDI
ncbi:MAG: patatin-like phospholipase family protein [Lachnospiraceae bacterium]|nr:patatin-like phospholipase family protein [Lachnospiraceae bacterium]